MDTGNAFREAVVERLRQLIRSRGVTVAGIERALGRSRGYLADALRGDKRLTLEAVAEVLEHLGVSPEAFFAAAPRRQYRWADELAEEVAEPTGHAGYGEEATWECPCRRLQRRLDVLVRALEAGEVIDPTTAARLREP